jgi:hypothetical protein
MTTSYRGESNLRATAAIVRPAESGHLQQHLHIQIEFRMKGKSPASSRFYSKVLP